MYKSLQTTHDTQRRTKTDSNRSSESLNLFSIQDFKNYNTYVHTFLKSQKNKRPMCHIAHLRQFKSLNKYDYIITLIKRRKKKLYGKLLVLHLKKFESPSPKDALCQVWLKLAQRFWRRNF